MAENKFIKTGIGVGVSFYDKNANDVPLIEAHKVLISGEVDENGQLNIDVDTQVRLDDKIIELENKINEAADAVNEETVKDIIKNNLNIENGSLEYGANNLQQKPEVKNGVTTTSWTSQNEQVQNWTGTNGQDSSVINRDGNTIYVGAFATENGGNAVVFGGKSQASGGKSFTAGSKNIALGNNAASFGNENFAAGQHSFTTGQQNAALGNASWAAGAQTVAKSTNDMTIGYRTIANGHKPEDGSNNDYHPNYRQSFPQFVIGRLNEEDSDFSNTEDSTGKDILSKKAFIIGGGIEEWNGNTATYNRKNVASIDYNGNMELSGSVKTDTIEDLNQLFANGDYIKNNKLYGLYQKSVWEKDGAGYYAERNPKLAAIVPSNGIAILQLQSGSVNSGKITEYNLTFTAGVHTGSNTTRDELRFNKYDSNNPEQWVSWATGRDAIALNAVTFAPGGSALAEGQGTIAYGLASHAEGYETIAEGDYSHAEGLGTWAAKNYSHASGYITQTTREGQTVIGIANEPENTEDKLFVIGNGSAIENLDKTFTVTKSNAMTVDYNGNGWFAGDITCTDAFSGTTISLASQAFNNSMEINDLKTRVSTLENQNGTIASDSITLKNAAGVTWKVSVDDNGDLIAEKL